MARRIRDAKLDTRSARARLNQRREPYWASMSGGLALGYRKGATGGTWIAKRYSAEHGRKLHAIGTADDILDADGKTVFSFDQAQARARDWLAKQVKQDRGEVAEDKGPYTVAKAMEAYFEFLESDGRPKHTLRDARYRDSAFIRYKFDDVDIAALTSKRLRRWRDDLATAAPRLRTRKGESQKHRKMADNEDARRARRASANRMWTILRAALNHAFENGKVDSDIAWRKVKPFKRVDAARIRYLTIAEAMRLINACDSDFRLLVQAALMTGARYGTLTRLTVSDFNPDAGTVAIRTSRKSKPFHVVLTDEGARFFRQVCAGRPGGEVMLRKEDGSAWGMSHQLRPIAAASERSKITPAVNFHCLRHTWASHAVMNGMPLMVVARNLGHADTRMVEKHYGHLAPSFISDAIRAGAPRFGFKAERKVVPMDGA
jgi:integrase